MPSTYSTSLRLELMGAGDQAGNWGNTTNNNLGSLIEQAITGVGNITMAPGTATTLTTGSGTVDQARNAVLVLVTDIGVPLTANRDLIVPSVNKFYAVRNATSGGFSVTVKTSAGTGVTLANGFTQLMYCDGTDVVLASVPINSTNNNVNVGGDLSVTGSISTGGTALTPMPTGSILEYGGSTAPTGWLLCDGSAVSRSTYVALWNVIGDAYGAGDGSTTFNLPDRRGRVGIGVNGTYLRGSTGGSETSTTSTDGAHSHGGTTQLTALTVAQMPAHAHAGTTDAAGSHSHIYENNLGGTFNGVNADGQGGINSSNTVRNTSTEGLHSHSFTTNSQGSGDGHLHGINTDGNHSHTTSTIQPYVASNYIIKA